jgi:hypothetical protein
MAVLWGTAKLWSEQTLGYGDAGGRALPYQWIVCLGLHLFVSLGIYLFLANQF